MKLPPRPENEKGRLDALQNYKLLDTLPEQSLDDLTALAGYICEAPISLISLVDESRQWFKSKIGAISVSETSRDISFCGHAILQKDLFIVEDATKDERFINNPLIDGDPHIRFYAGAPLITPGGHALGMLCIIDHVPRHLTQPQQDALRVLSRQVMAQIELRKQTRDLAESESRLRLVTDKARVGLVIVNRERRYVYANQTYAEVLNLESPDVVGKKVADILHGLYEAQVRPRLDEAFSGKRVSFELQRASSQGDYRYTVRYEPTLVDGQVEFVVVVITDISELKRAEAALGDALRFNQSTIDSLSAHLCVLDEAGFILSTNEAWRRFARENPPLSLHVGVGENYLTMADSVAGPEKTDAAAFAEGIRAVIRGETTEFSMEYSCHSPKEQRWFIGRVTRFIGEGPVRIVIAHENITKRKLGELASRRMAAIVEYSDDAIIGKDLSGVVTSWNKGAEKVFGYKAEEMLGQSILKLIPPDRHSEEDLILGRIRNGESVEHFETLRRTKDGRVIDISVTASPIKDGAGKVVGASKVARDITERKKMLTRLQEQDERLRLYAEHSPAAVAMFDDDMKYLVASRRWMDDYNLAGKNIIGRSHYEIFPEIDDRWKKIHQRCLAGAVEKCEEDPFRRSNGTTDWLRWEIRPWHRADGGIGGIIVFSENITERKRAQERLRRLVNSNVQGVMFARTSGPISDANDAFLEIVGYNREDLTVGKLDWAALTPPECAGADARAVQELKTKGICTPYEKEFIRKDGKRVAVLLGAAAFEDGPDEGVCFVLDLTERKKLEAQFLRAQRMESVGTLAGGIAHDLNNVLAPILMAIEVLKLEAENAENLSLLSTIQTSAERGAALVKQVLSFARGVEGQRVTVNPVHILRELVKVAKETFPKSIDLRFEPAKDVWTVTGDPTQIHQVFLNLCVNARDAMPQGGVLTVRMENVVLDETYCAMNPDSHPGAYVMIKVEDTGTGIPQEIREKIFEPFFTTKELGKGTGLGLSTTIGIVKSHSGFIHLYSEPGKGTKFKVYFPANTDKVATENTAIAQTQLPCGRGELLLVVDDEAPIREIAKKTLERFGYKVLLACHGAEAISHYALHRDKIAVVITDMAMPIMDGPALIIALKSINPDVKIIGSSGLNANGGVAKAVGAGVEHFIPKPYTAETMLKTLHIVLQGK